MIARVAEGDREAFAALLQRDPLFGGRIATAFDCWGEHPRACGFYRAGRSAVLLAGARVCMGREALEYRRYRRSAPMGIYQKCAGLERRLREMGICVTRTGYR